MPPALESVAGMLGAILIRQLAGTLAIAAADR
jgi:hypothetical protein